MSRRRGRGRVPVPELRGRRCLITGAASGIGRATALAASARGAELFLTDLHEEPLGRVVEEIRAAGGASHTPRRRTSPTTTRSSRSASRSTPRTARWTSS